MARWSDLAVQDSTPNHGGAMLEQRGVVLHIAEGYYWGTRDYQKSSANQVSSHFIVSDGVKGQGRDGDCTQMVDTDVTAWTERAGNGHWLSIEFAGFTPHALTAAQVEKAAQIFARGHKVYGYPLQLATSPTGRGLGHHSMGTNGHSVPTDTWTGDTWGHEDCPGPAIIAQKPAILARAIDIVNGVDMATVDLNLGQVIATVGGADLSLRNTFVSLYLRSLPDEASRLAAILEAAHDDSETQTHIPDEDRAALVAAILAALPPSSGGSTPSLAEIAAAVCDEQDRRALARLGG